MFNNDTLQQLAKLKQDIQDSKDIATGRVVGSNGRFGFVKLEDGRDAFLSPEKMNRLIPGDIVQVNVVKNAQEKLEAELERLITPALSRFIGEYRIKGKAHFIQPSGAQAARWIFVPPKFRAKIKEGDCVVAQMISHPFKDGKAAAKILEKVGTAGDVKFEYKYVRAKYDLNKAEDAAVQKQVTEIEKQFVHEAYGEREDFTHLPFVTIDAATTKDMDDAIAIEGDAENGWTLHVAIADPSSFFAPNSPLGKSSLALGQSTYLLGGLVPMLPPALSHHCFSLEEGKKRPALIATLNIDTNGACTSSEFKFGVVASRHKLSYDDVAALIEGESHEVPESCRDMLHVFKAFADVRKQYREANFLLPQEQHDYDFQLDEQGHIEAIGLRPRNVAHRMVEEAMLIINLAGAELLAKHQKGLGVCHPGFRPERLGEVKALLKEENIEFGDLETREGFVALLQSLANNEAKQPLIAPLRRMMDSANLKQTFNPHLGLGMPCYANISSPIRRFADLFNHWAMQSILLDKPFKALNDRQIEALSERLDMSRQADRELSVWLCAIYAQSLLNTQARGKVRIVTQQGFGVKLNDTGIEGFVLFPKKVEKKYDAKRMTLEINGQVFALEQEVDVNIDKVDLEKRRIAFSLFDDPSKASSDAEKEKEQPEASSKEEAKSE